MDTQVKTPHNVFLLPQRLLVPLFQRPYVWNAEKQWQPLWEDVARVAERLLVDPSAPPHFLGAVVLQQEATPVGTLQRRIVIDGQQRLTTLQLLLDALHAELLAVGAVKEAARIESLVENPDAYCEADEDRFKVWPTNRDRPAFNAVMGAEPPVDYDALPHGNGRLVQAHRFFAERARHWLNCATPEETARRAEAVELAVRERLQIVVIDLTAAENAQEIFETLNARGTQLTSADLIKNFVFQRLMEQGADVEALYEARWKEFETAFWEYEIASGRVRYSRSSLFLNHWLIARTGEQIGTSEVFTRFKRFADDTGLQMSALLEQLHRAAGVYRRILEGALKLTGDVDRLELFAYRTDALQSASVRPVVLHLLDPELPPVPQAQLVAAIEALESYLVRRTITRADTGSHSKLFADLIAHLASRPRLEAGDEVRRYLQEQRAANLLWPDDNDVCQELAVMPAYARLVRARLRVVLEGLEDHLRGFRDGRDGLGGERVARGKLTIEHLMPQQWSWHWQAPAGITEAEREVRIHMLGNLTLLPGAFNARVSNGPWDGESGKRGELKKHDVYKLNHLVLEEAGDEWTDEKILQRTERLSRTICEIWRVPNGYSRPPIQAAGAKVKRWPSLLDLYAEGILQPGSTVHAAEEKASGRTAIILADGRVDVEGVVFPSLSAAASHIAGGPRNGWHFFFVDPINRVRLLHVWQQYTASLEDPGALDLRDEDVADDSEQ